MSNSLESIVILADGEFPTNQIPLAKLKEAGQIICCDGAALNLIEAGMKPTAIVGDMDSLPSKFQDKYSNIIFKNECQESNDLTKAFNFALALNPQSITILGATGMREDHSLGNISLLAQYAAQTDIPLEMLTNHGIFNVIFKNGIFSCEPGEQVSLFSLDCSIKIKSKGLKYPLDNVIFDSWYKATLNECDGNFFELYLSNSSPIIIFRAYSK